MIKAEAAPLATGHQQDRNLPATQGVFAESAGLWAFVPERNDRRRRDLLRPRQHKRLVPLRIQLTQLFQIDRPQLFEQAAALVVVQAVPRGDHVFLAVLAELVSQVRRHVKHDRSLAASLRRLGLPRRLCDGPGVVAAAVE